MGESLDTPSIHCANVRGRICDNCGLGSLDLVDERPHPVLGIAGKPFRTLRCSAVDCGAYVIEST